MREGHDPNPSKYRYMKLHTPFPHHHLTVEGESEASLRKVYPNVIRVTTTLSTVLDIDGGGGESDLPVVGISPAKIEVESVQISATAIANRFMGFSSFGH